VYVSSTVADLAAERQAVIDWLVTAEHQPMHSYRPNSETVRDSCLEDIDGCDLYVLVLGHRYGFQPEQDNPKSLSITHLEFRRAKQSKIPRIALLRTSVPDIRASDLLNAPRAALVRAFEEEVRREVRPAEFSDLRGLIQGLSTGVQHELENLRTIVRSDDSQTIQIVATLTQELARKNQMIDERETENVSLRGRVKELEDELLRSAVARTLTAAAQPDASEAEIAAVNALEAGDTKPAQTLLEKQEAREVAQIGTPGVDDVLQRQEAAALAREQGAFAMSHNVGEALVAFQRAAEHDPNDTWTHFLIGDLQLLLGSLSAATESFRRARLTIEARLRSTPDDITAQRDVSVTYDRIGDVLVTQGDGPGALDSYRKSLGIREALASRDPANTEWQRDLSVSHNKIGNVLLAQGDGPSALDSYRKDLEIAEALAARDPANTEWQRDLSVSHNKIGDVLVAQGDGPGALDSYRKGHEIAEALAARDPANTGWQRDLSVTHERIGNVLIAQGDGRNALDSYRKSLGIREALAARDPANTEWQRDLSVSHDKIGDVLVAQGDGPGALDSYRKSLGIREALASRDPANTEWQRDLSVSHSEIGDVLVAQGDGPGALDSYRKDLEIAEALAARDPANTEWQTDLALSCSKLGTLAHLPSDLRTDYLQRGLEILVKLKQENRLLPSKDWIGSFDQQLAELTGGGEDDSAN
ncbi:MAG TPA: DUF4062 domain-containing protein, partial [Pyrinomonadaceae bacterium]